VIARLATWGLVWLLLLGQAAAEERRALVIAVDATTDRNIPVLQGCASDAARMREVLVKHGGFPAGNVQVLTGRDANRAAVLHALEQLAAASGSGDRVVLYFAGHGASTPGHDALIPYDGVQKAITDEDLAARLQACSGARILLILDAGQVRAALPVVCTRGLVVGEMRRTWSFAWLSEVHNEAATFHLDVSADIEGGRSAIGHTVCFRVGSDRDCYLTLIDIGTDGSTTVLFPNKAHPDAFVRAHEPISIPSAGMGFSIRIQGPCGREMVKAIATSRPVDLGRLLHGSAVFGSFNEPAAFREELVGVLLRISAERRPRERRRRSL
jgi:hypothetical protein